MLLHFLEKSCSIADKATTLIKFLYFGSIIEIVNFSTENFTASHYLFWNDIESLSATLKSKLYSLINVDNGRICQLLQFKNTDIFDIQPCFQLLRVNNSTFIYVYIHNKRKRCCDFQYDMASSLFACNTNTDYTSCNEEGHDHGKFLPAYLSNHEIKFDENFHGQLNSDDKNALDQVLEQRNIDDRFNYENNPDDVTYTKEVTWRTRLAAILRKEYSLDYTIIEEGAEFYRTQADNFLQSILPQICHSQGEATPFIVHGLPDIVMSTGQSISLGGNGNREDTPIEVKRGEDNSKVEPKMIGEAMAQVYLLMCIRIIKRTLEGLSTDQLVQKGLFSERTKLYLITLTLTTGRNLEYCITTSGQVYSTGKYCHYFKLLLAP